MTHILTTDMTARHLRDAYCRSCHPEYSDDPRAIEFRRLFKRHRTIRDVPIIDLLERAKDFL